jgi:hypothetical protein
MHDARRPGRRVPVADARSLRSDPDGERGAAAVEFALVAPLLFLLLFGIVGLGWGFWEHESAQASAREVAREVSLGIPDRTVFARNAACASAGNTASVTPLNRLNVDFFSDVGRTLLTSYPPPIGSYARVTLTYRSAMAGTPFAFLSGENGTFAVSALTVLEQGSSPTAVDGPLELDMTGVHCG